MKIQSHVGVSYKSDYNKQLCDRNSLESWHIKKRRFLRLLAIALKVFVEDINIKLSR